MLFGLSFQQLTFEVFLVFELICTCGFALRRKINLQIFLFWLQLLLCVSIPDQTKLTSETVHVRLEDPKRTLSSKEF